MSNMYTVEPVSMLCISASTLSKVFQSLLSSRLGCVDF